MTFKSAFLKTFILGLIVVLAACKDDESPAKPQMVIGDTKINLSDVNIYLVSDYEDDFIEDESSASTHRYQKFEITDADFLTECDDISYFGEIELYYPIGETADGKYDFEGGAFVGTSRYFYVEFYHSIPAGSTACEWGTPYRWWGADENPAPNVQLTIKTNGDDISISLPKGSWDDWTNNNSWTLEGSINVSLTLKGTVIDYIMN